MLPCTQSQLTCEHVRYHDATTALIACHGMHPGCFRSFADANALIWALFKTQQWEQNQMKQDFVLQGCASSIGSIIKPDQSVCEVIRPGAPSTGFTEP